RGHERERVRVGALEPRQLELAVEEDRVDEEGAAVVGAADDRAHELGRGDVGGDGDDLTGLDVRARADGEVGELLEEHWVDDGRLHSVAMTTVVFRGRRRASLPRRPAPARPALPPQ